MIKNNLIKGDNSMKNEDEYEEDYENENEEEEYGNNRQIPFPIQMIFGGMIPPISSDEQHPRMKLFRNQWELSIKSVVPSTNNVTCDVVFELSPVMTKKALEN